jgi:hypothetical protein
MIEVWTLTVESDKDTTTTIEMSEADCLNSLRRNYDPEREYPDDDFVQSMIDEQGLVIHMEPHRVIYHYPELDGFTVSTGPVLRHDVCGMTLCDVEDGDVLNVYARLASDHLRFNANVGSECPAHPLNPKENRA